MAAKKKSTGEFLAKRRASVAKAKKAVAGKRTVAHDGGAVAVVKTKAKPLTKVKVVRKGESKGRKRLRQVDTDPVKAAKALAKRAAWLDRHAAKCARLAAKHRAGAALTAQKALNRAERLGLTEKQRVALTDIVASGYANSGLASAPIPGVKADPHPSMLVVESPDDTAEALKVVSEVLKASLR
jgi:hypothetical protein